MKIINFRAKAGDACRRAHNYLLSKQHEIAASPPQRRLMLTSALLTFGGLTLVGSAHAAPSTGIASLVHTGTDQAASIKTDLGIVFAALGFGGAGYGGINWIKKGREGEHSQIKASQIFIPILAGAALGSIGFVMATAGESVGINHTTHGSVPTA
ncbi:MAG: hypothetical protein V4724_39770 [Pseudomonadota bacterium]